MIVDLEQHCKQLTTDCLEDYTAKLTMPKYRRPGLAAHHDASTI